MNAVLIRIATVIERWKKQLEGKDIKSRDAANAASPSPSTDGEHVWAMMGNGVISCFTVNGELIWKKDPQKDDGKFDIQFGMSTTPLVYDGLVYLAGEKGDVSCVDAQTGEVLYRERLVADKHRATPVAANGNIYIAGRRGKVVVLQAGRELNVLAKNELGEEITASPAIADGRVYIRTFDALYAFGEK